MTGDERDGRAVSTAHPAHVIGHGTARLHHNLNAGFHAAGYPGIFYLGVGTHPIVIDSTINERAAAGV